MFPELDAASDELTSHSGGPYGHLHLAQQRVFHLSNQVAMLWWLRVAPAGLAQGLPAVPALPPAPAPSSSR